MSTTVILHLVLIVLHTIAALMAFHSSAALVFNACAASANILMVIYHLHTPSRPDKLPGR